MSFFDQPIPKDVRVAVGVVVGLLSLPFVLAFWFVPAAMMGGKPTQAIGISLVALIGVGGLLASVRLLTDKPRKNGTIFGPLFFLVGSGVFMVFTAIALLKSMTAAFSLFAAVSLALFIAFLYKRKNENNNRPEQSGT